MTVEEQMLMKSLAAECERLHKELQVAEKHIDYLKEDKNQLYARCDETARDAFKMGAYCRIRITSISKFVRLHKELEKHRWIPVSERLPEDAQEVLYSTKTGCVFHGEYYDDNTDRKWFSYKDDIFSFNNVVNAWMPLPEPYQKGE